MDSEFSEPREFLGDSPIDVVPKQTAATPESVDGQKVALSVTAFCLGKWRFPTQHTFDLLQVLSAQRERERERERESGIP